VLRFGYETGSNSCEGMVGFEKQSVEPSGRVRNQDSGADGWNGGGWTSVDFGYDNNINCGVM
jgi:hypothetical protein